MSLFAYSYRPRAFARERSYRLEHDRLVVETGGDKRSVAYADITQIRFHKYSIRGATGATRALNWRCTLYCRSGAKLTLLPTHAARFGIKEDRSLRYLPFVAEAQQRIKAANPQVAIELEPHWTLQARQILGEASGRAAVRLLGAVQHVDPDVLAATLGRAMRMVGPRLPAHRVARDNLAAAYPEMSAAERRQILAGMWDNIGRSGAEHPHLGRFLDRDGPTGRVLVDPSSKIRALSLGRLGKPALIFGAHLANIELLPVGLAGFAVDFAVVYRRLNTGPLANKVFQIRSSLVGASSFIEQGSDTPLRMRAALRRGASILMVVDQYHPGGVDVVFFGRTCKANPTLARLARTLELPIRGARVVRLPGERFSWELTEPLELPRDASGKVDVAATMQAITAQIEAWVREHPEQWLWAHRRWR